MRFVPASCGDLVLPDDCLDAAFRIGDRIIEVVLAALDPFFPEGSQCTFAGFVSFADRGQPDDLGDQATILLERIEKIRLRDKPCLTLWELAWRLEVVFNGFPALEQGSDVDVYLPTVEAQEKVSRWLYAIGLTLTDTLFSELSSPTAATALSTVHSWTLGPMLPVGPRGVIAGWKTGIITRFSQLPPAPVP